VRAASISGVTPVLIVIGALMFVSRPDEVPVPFCSTIVVAGGGGGFEWST
jgi:hypothetical protein